jgi:hypothetical protein
VDIASKCICGSTPNVGARKEVYGQSSLFTVMCPNENCGVITESKSSIDSAIGLWNNHILYLEKKRESMYGLLVTGYSNLGDARFKGIGARALFHCGVSPILKTEETEYHKTDMHAVFCGNKSCSMRPESKETIIEAIEAWNEKVMRESTNKIFLAGTTDQEKASEKQIQLVCGSDDKIGIKLFDGRFVIDPSNTLLKNSEILSIFEGMKNVKIV